jgi:hypothetical protein
LLFTQQPPPDVVLAAACFFLGWAMTTATAAVRGKKGPAPVPAEVGPPPEALLLTLRDLEVVLARCRKTLRKELRAGWLPPPVYRSGKGKMAWSRAEIQLWVSCGCPPMSRWRPGGGGHA